MLHRRQFVAAALAAAVVPLVPAAAQEGGSADEPLPDMVLGQADAPIEIIEYASMTCPHCAAFHQETLPGLLENWIEPGRAKLVFREFPLDRVALIASAVARCAGPEHYFGFVDVFFETQATWARAEDPIAEIKKIVRMGGLDPAMVDTCVEDEALIDGILRMRVEGSEMYDIDATPSFVFDGELHSGNMSYEELDALLNDIEGNG